MKKDFGINREIGFVSHLVTIITLTVFSAVLILLNIILGWEKWTIPVIIAGAAICLGVHISGKGSARARIYCYGLFLIFEIFYYSVNISTLYDSTGLIVIMCFVFAMSGERTLVAVGSLGGIGGMLLHLWMISDSKGLIPEPASIVRSVWQFALVALGAVLADRLSSAWFNTEKLYQDRIGTILEENERANNFLANVSHEIRTPINAVMGLAAIMEKEKLPEGVKGNMSAIAEAGHRVADQIGDIMDYTEIDMKKLSVSNERYMINSVVNDLVSQLRFTEDYGLDLVIDLDPRVPCELIGDDSKIKKILRHLITNGFKFTAQGGVNVHIFAKKRGYGINLELEVTDTGSGMTDTEIEHIYDKFYQSNSGRSRSAGGLGLGIPIVNGIARAMGGFIHIESTPGRGTLVRVSIPQEVSDNTPCITVGSKDDIRAAGFLSFMTTSDSRIKDFHMEMVSHFVKALDIQFRRVRSVDELKRLTGEWNITHLFVGTGEYLENREYIESLCGSMNIILVEDKDFRGAADRRIALMKKPFYGMQIANFLNQSNIKGQSTSRERMTCPGVKVLVVDDEPMNLLVARGIFEAYGMEVHTAASGTESIEMCRADRFDIIFMDHMMPGLDGVETMKRLRLNAARVNDELCIVALTANAISSAKEMFIAEGFNAFLPKPIELMELERVLKHVLPRSSVVYETVPITIKETETPPAAETAPVPAEPAPEAPAVRDPWAVLKECGVDIGEGLGYCQDDEDFYREILAEYAAEPDEKLKVLNELFGSEDWKDYGIKVHAIKSSSKTIGADAVSEMAKELEFAAKSDNADLIRERHAAFTAEYSRLLGAVAEVLADGSDKTNDPETGGGV